MSERKVLTKYYPPDFDPSKIVRSRGSKKEPGQASKLATVRLMAPFSMKCLACGEFIYKGRKFNARKETTDEKYLSNIPIYRFYIRCTRCSGEITFKTDPKNMDYVAEKGAKRNFERWRDSNPDEEEGGVNRKIETEEEMLDRLEEEAAKAAGAGGAMAELEAKVHDARTEMAIADALDEIRVRNARIQRAEGKEGEGQGKAVELAEQKRRELQEEKRRIEREDEEAARRAFAGRNLETDIEIEDIEEKDEEGGDTGARRGGAEDKTSAATTTTELAPTTAPAPVPAPAPAPPPTFKKQVKKKKDFSAALGIVKKPSLV